MGCDCGDSIPFDFEPTGIAFGSKLKGKLSPRAYIVFSVWGSLRKKNTKRTYATRVVSPIFHDKN